MYICKQCGNKKYFNEMNYVKTYVVLDEETGEVQFSEDEFIECTEVYCGVCKASSEDGNILDRKTNKPIKLYN